MTAVGSFRGLKGHRFNGKIFLIDTRINFWFYQVSRLIRIYCINNFGVQVYFNLYAHWFTSGYGFVIIDLQFHKYFCWEYPAVTGKFIRLVGILSYLTAHSKSNIDFIHLIEIKRSLFFSPFDNSFLLGTGWENLNVQKVSDYKVYPSLSLASLFYGYPLVTVRILVYVWSIIVHPQNMSC